MKFLIKKNNKNFKIKLVIIFKILKILNNNNIVLIKIWIVVLKNHLRILI